MTSERSYIFAILAGVFLSIFGLFLPWGERIWLPVWELSSIILGVELAVGQVALVGCIVTVASLTLSKISNKRYWCALVLLGGLISHTSTSAWIISPGVLAMRGWFSYGILFGVYVSLTGSTITSTSAILYFLHH